MEKKKINVLRLLFVLVIIVLMLLGTWMFGNGSKAKKLNYIDSKADQQIANPYDAYDTSDVSVDLYKTLKKTDQQIELVGENSI